MILEKDPLSMAETLEIVKNQEIIDFIHHFIKLKPDDAKKLKQELEALSILKISSEHLIKMMDLLPTTAVELNKIFVNESLEENEINKILEITKKYE